MKEIWKDVPGFEGLYKVSSFGNAYSYPRSGSNGRYLKPNTKSKYGYHYYVFSKDNRPKTLKVHRLVALLFVPNPENKPHVNHLDGNKENNRVDNLEWCTARENIIHAHKMNLTIHKKSHENPLSKLSEQQMLDIAKAYAIDDVPQSLLAKDYGVSQHLISVAIKVQLEKFFNWIEQGKALDKIKLTTQN